MHTIAMTTAQGSLLVVVFVFGCAVGSFLNVCIWRMPRGLGINSPRRSFCPRCSTPINWFDNIPVLSFIALGGKCRACGKGISWRYPAVELVTGLLFALVYHRQGVQVQTEAGQLVIMMLLTALLIVGSGIDIDWLIIPDEISLFGILGGLAAGLLLPGLHVGDMSYHTFGPSAMNPHLGGLLGAGIGMFVGGGIVLGCALFGYLIFRKEAMGIGDAKLLGMVGAFFGWKVALITFFISPFVGLLYGVPILLTRDEHVMPYGPFLSVGAVVTMVFRSSLCGRLAGWIDSLAVVTGGTVG